MLKNGKDLGALTVTVKEGHRIYIGDDIEIVATMTGGKGLGRAVRLTVIAPKDVPVNREKRLIKRGMTKNGECSGQD